MYARQLYLLRFARVDKKKSKLRNHESIFWTSTSYPMAEYLNKQFLHLFPAKDESSLITVTTNTPYVFPFQRVEVFLSGIVCLKTLRDNNIFCCPVMSSEHEDRVVGLISLVDVAAFAVQLFDTNPSRTRVNFDALYENALKVSTAHELYSMCLR